MRLKYLSYIFSLELFYFGFLLLIPIISALIYGETNAILPFVSASFASFFISFIFKKLSGGVNSINDIKKGEGLFAVASCWMIAGLFSSIPYMFFGFSPINAFFESASGITATGATILTHFDYPHSLFFWRAFTQWLGGMGIIVLFIAILPQFAIAGRQLFFAEAPGPTEDKFTPRIKNTASSLWKVYFGLTILALILLKINGMSWFDSICHSFTTVSGGGFSTNAESMVGSSNSILSIFCLFMFFAGASYNLQYKAWSKFNPVILFKNEEFRVYFGIFAGISVLLGLSLFAFSHYSITECFTHSFFQVSSVISTSGFCSVDFASWDFTSKILLFTAMLAGSCASSAGGGIKIMRWLLIAKIIKAEVAKILHPKAVFNIKIGKYSVPKEVLYQTLMFVFFYLGIAACSAFFVSIVEHNSLVGLSGTISSLGNIGPGLGKIIGPLGSFDSLNPFTKAVFIIDMYAGRLEIIPFLALFQKDLWHIK